MNYLKYLNKQSGERHKRLISYIKHMARCAKEETNAIRKDTSETEESSQEKQCENTGSLYGQEVENTEEG